MHATTLVAGIAIVLIALSVLYFSAAFSNLSLCLDGSEASPFESSIESFAVCNPMNFAPHILSFAVGSWLIIFGAMSRSAKSILTNMRFIYAVLAAGGALWVFIFSTIVASAFDNTVSFAPPNPLITTFTINPLATAALGAGLVLLALAGYVIKKSANPARILMWVAAFVAVAVVSGLFSAGNNWVVLGAIGGMVAALILLRKRRIPSYAVAAVVVISVASIVLSYQIEEIGGYYPELAPDVFFVTSNADGITTIEGISLTKRVNSSRTLGPECSLDPSCVKNYSEGLADLSLYEGSDGRAVIVSATLSNNGINPINVTTLHMTGLITAATGKPQSVEVQAIRDPHIAGIMGSLLAPREELSAGSIIGPVTINPGESLYAYIKGPWNLYSERENSPFPFQAHAAYEYEMQPSVRPLRESTNCVEFCGTGYGHLPANFHRGYWSLTTGSQFTDITKLNVNIISHYVDPSDPATELSYAGCMSRNDAVDLYSRRNTTLGFPDYLPTGFSLFCISDENETLAQIYGNISAPGIKDYIDDDPRLIYRTSATEPGSLVVTMRLAIMPNEFIMRASEEADELKTSDEFSSIRKSYIREVQGGSILVKVFDGGSSSVDLNLADRQYHVFGRGVSEDDLVRVAESISR